MREFIIFSIFWFLALYGFFEIIMLIIKKFTSWEECEKIINKTNEDSEKM